MENEILTQLIGNSPTVGAILFMYLHSSKMQEKFRLTIEKMIDSLVRIEKDMEQNNGDHREFRQIITKCVVKNNS